MLQHTIHQNSGLKKSINSRQHAVSPMRQVEKDTAADCHIIELSPAIKEKAIDLRRNYSLKLPDAIIAATAVELNLPLISGDGVFSRVDELNFAHYML